MALDSLPGINDSTVIQGLAEPTKAVLNNFLTDTQNSLITETALSGGSLFTGTGSNNEQQSIIVGDGSATIIGGINLGDTTLDVGLGSTTTLLTLENHTPQTDINGYINQVISSVVDAESALSNSLQQATQQVVGLGVGTLQLVQVINPSDAGPTTINATGSANTVSVLNLNQVGSGGLIVTGMDSVIAVGNGAITIGGNTNTIIAGDLRDQIITGGGGNDTIFGGAGNDTVIGGVGDDTFGFGGGIGGIINTVIEDFSEGDKLRFIIEGINNVQQLRELITSVDTSDGNFTAHFLDGSTITLVGVSAEQVTADLISFN